MITVFYDGKCGICRREIAHYQRIAPLGIFDWQDITRDASRIEALGVAYADALRLLHVLDDKGALHVGIDAFIVMWRALPRWRILAFVVAMPLIHPLLSYAYRSFAKWRFKQLAHCQIAIENKHPPE